MPKTYVSNGVEKKQWNNVGTLVYFPPQGEKTEGFILELSMFPGVKFSVFEQTPKVEKTIQTEAVDTTTSPSEDYPDGLNVEDIPF